MCDYISKILIQFLQPIKYNDVSDLLPQSHLNQKGVKKDSFHLCIPYTKKNP